MAAPKSSPLISALARLAKRMGQTPAHLWRNRIADLYGALGGQRALDRDAAARPYLNGQAGATAEELVIALQTCFALLCDVLAVSHLNGGPTWSGVEVTSAGPRAARAALADLTSGRALAALGVTPAANPVPLDWFIARLARREIALIQEVIATTLPLAQALPHHADVMQWLYARIMPRNLLHVLGEFYTPPWLAELLLEDSGWEPTQRLIDPFAGSGVFLVAALNRARRQGCDPRELLPDLAAVDLNPAAYVATRANLLRNAVPTGSAGQHAVRLPIRCADSLLPVVPESAASDGLAPADVLVTNPPWVGWEYLSPPYRARLHAAWQRYGLYTAKGRDAAFLKEDLSTLALVAAWDRYLRPGGTSAVVLRPASMQSHLAARGLRRLSLHPDSEPLSLRLIRTFDGLRPFANTPAAAAAWVLTRGAPTCFPVPVKEWRSARSGWQPGASSALEEVRAQVTETELAATRGDPHDAGSAWTVGAPRCLDATAALLGANEYHVRTGVFTGGANAVYYLDRLPRRAARGCHWYRNVVAGAKRAVPAVEAELEDALIYEVVRGRDLALWAARPGALILCPHSPETRMRAIPKDHLAKRCPKATAYLSRMRKILDDRKGFSGWERHVREEAFYAIQRIGDYTFGPYKTAWRYIASDFLVAVIGPGERERPRLCNDKVMYVAFDDEQEAYYLCGVLSADPVRWRVVSTMTGTQISTSAIRHLRIPRYAARDGDHRRIAEACRRGHAALANGRPDAAEAELATINAAVARVYGLPDEALAVLRAELSRRFSARRFG